MSKSFNEMTKDELAEAMHDILEWNHQWIDPVCPWCEAEEYPVNEQGVRTNDESASEYRTDHGRRCAVTLIEAIFANEYEYLNEPTKDRKEN